MTDPTTWFAALSPSSRLLLSGVAAGLAGLGLGALIVGLWARSTRTGLFERLFAARQAHESAVAEARELQTALADARADKARLETRLESERRHAEGRLADLREAREALTHQFKTLSQEILEEKSQRFTEHSRASLEPLLTPLREHIGRFEKQVREAYDAENRQRSALAEQVRQLEASNRAIAEDATQLTHALKGESKTQGNWGEMILETVLERSGLVQGVQYVTQFAATDDSGRRQLPDAVVHLPGERDLVIDAKVSLTDYLRVHEAGDPAGRQAALTAHIASVRRHLKQLSAKRYQGIESIRSLDYVFMFVPSEAAYVEAMRADADLQREALALNIALVSPATLMPMLRTVENLWRLDRQEKNAEKIAERAGLLHDKFVGFLADLDKVSRGLDTVTRSFGEARGKLVDGRGNLVRQAEMLREMGANTAKTMPDDWHERAALGEERSMAPGQPAGPREPGAESSRRPSSAPPYSESRS
ncbi:DNA recombination protein RmuC [Salinisphaera sp. T31B1]|uniref:DNA recombination protein RmuC n=1 Tax=Salinisphaera sp. T31B1 TaxID=727963 RepID=UPI0033425282